METRDIKFRVWDINKKKFITEVPENIVEANISLDFETRYLKRWFGFKLMQYTGLKDKNGKEIFESDLLEYWDKNIPSNKFKVEVVFINGRFTMNHLSTQGIYQDFEEDGYVLEVIGNIYEDKKLLK